MAQIVCIDTDTLRDTVGIDDIVSLHDDDVDLGPGYSSFKIYYANATVAEIRAAIRNTSSIDSPAKYSFTLANLNASEKASLETLTITSPEIASILAKCVK